MLMILHDHLCGLVVRVPGYRSRGPSSIPSYQIFWEVLGLEWGPLSLVSTIEELLEKKGSGFSLEIENTAVGDPLQSPRGTLSTKVGFNFADKWRSLGRYSSLAGFGHVVLF
jgi:hypothetical protein